MELSLESSRVGGEASTLSESATGGHETDGEYVDEEDQLRTAGRFGMLLLEKNNELLNEVSALRIQVKALEDERPGLKEELLKQESGLEVLREERRQSILEANSLRSQLRAQAALVTDLMDRDQRMKEEKSAADDARQRAEFQFTRLQTEYEEMLRRQASEQPQVVAKEHITVVNPAAIYDSNQSSTFTLAEHEELQTKYTKVSEENDTLLRELKSVRKDLDAMKRRVVKMGELQAVNDRLEKKMAQLQYALDASQSELTERRTLWDSLQLQATTYKRIAESRPFSGECVCSVHKAGTPRDAHGRSIQEQLAETNLRLEQENRKLRAQLSGDINVASRESDISTEGTDESASNNTSNNHNHGVDNGDGEEASVERDSMDMQTPTPRPEKDLDFETSKLQDAQEKMAALRDSLHHARHQWQAAIASQKALEECNAAAQAEIARLTQLINHQVSNLASRRGDRSASTSTDGSSNNNNDSSGGSKVGGVEDEDEKWAEDTAAYPAPPGDLNSPLIKCLLDHWTTDKSKIMHLTDWLHHAIRGTGRPRPLRLEHLTSEVAAGFTQLLIPILRERHSVSVSIYRRESVQILTDMVFQATQPAESPSFFTTIAAKLSEVMGPAAGSATTDQEAMSPNLRQLGGGGGSSNGSSEAGSASAQPRRQRMDPAALVSEAHFLYG